MNAPREPVANFVVLAAPPTSPALQSEHHGSLSTRFDAARAGFSSDPFPSAAVRRDRLVRVLDAPDAEPAFVAPIDQISAIGPRTRRGDGALRRRRRRQDARSRGATVVTLGGAYHHPRHVPPTVFVRVDDDMKVMREETFGPLLPVETYAGLDDALRRIDGRAHPLALYWFGDKPVFVQRRVAPSGILHPPYGAGFEWMPWLLRRLRP